MIDTTRRGLLGGGLALSVTPLACSAPGSSAAGHGVKAGPGILQPGPRWTGRPGSGGEVPAQSHTPLGTLVPDERFIGGFSAIPGQWVHGRGIRITALGLPPQAAEGNALNYFKEAVFVLEGNSVTVTEWSVNNTPVRMHDGTTMPQGSIGFSVEIGAGEGAVTAGDAILYCYLRGEHGLERRIEIPLVINVDHALDPDRAVRYLDPEKGDDAAAGTRAAPWRTLGHALSNAGVGDGGKLVLAAGRYLEDTNTTRRGQLNNRRAIEVVAEDGVAPDKIVISRTNRFLPERRWVIQARVVHFIGLTFDLRQLMQLAGPRDRIIGFFASRLVDPIGPDGPRDGNGFLLGFNTDKGPPPTWEIVISGFLPAPGLGNVYLAECLFANFLTQGAALYRNVTAYDVSDSFAGGPGYDDVVVDGYFVTMPRSGLRRLHSASHLTIAGAERGPNGTTLLTLADVGDLTPLLEKRDLWKLQFLSGVPAQAGIVDLVSADPVTRRAIVRGDFAGQLRPGDRIRLYAIWHADFCQQEGVRLPTHRGLHNTTIFRYRAESPTSQLFLTQAPVPLEPGSRIATQGTRFQLTSGSGKPNVAIADDMLRLQEGQQAGEYRIVRSFDPASGSGVLLDPFSADQAGTAVQRSKSITDFVMALSILRKTGDGWEQGQFQDGHRNFLLTQNTFISQPGCLLFRSKFAGHGHRNHVQLFNLASKMDADAGQMPTYGLRIERNHFLRGRPQGAGSRLGEGPLTFDANQRYKPFRGQLRIGRKPLIPFDSFGNPVDETSPVGAVAV